MKDFTIDAAEFLNREKKVLGYLRGKICSRSISAAAEVAWQKTNSRGYEFSATWPAYNGNEVLDITIAGIVQLDVNGAFTFSSYVLSISQDKRLLRKYHYDHECNQINKPLFHLQYGGQPLPSHDGFDGVDELAPWLSEPRLFATPMSLALILEQVFLEFPDEDTKKIQNDPHWKGHVLESQRKILYPFFERCCQKISNNERLYSECYI